jgi:uncharacterized protein YcnI
MIRPRTAARLTLLSLGATMLGVLAVSGPAAAHVTVNGQGATQGGYTRVAFRVPNESDTASTTKLEVFLPQDAPIASVSTQPVPGWTVAVTKGKPAKPLQANGSEITEVVTKLTWTATADAVIKAGQFQEFPVSLGPLPETDQLVFKALQTYSDGNIVRWIDEPVAPGAEEPQSPAPALAVAKAGATTAPVAAAAPAATAADDDDDSDEGNGLAVGLGIAGLVAGLAGLALGGLAFARTRTVADAPTS